MSIGLLFWILMILWLLCGPWPFWGPNSTRPFAFHFIGFVLLALLGWKVFGPALHG
jgi:hypothetical protein